LEIALDKKPKSKNKGKVELSNQEKREELLID
jgi:hypothetical protein